MEQREALPAAVRRQLRREVGFGCPICRSPFLTWHHFDPPYHVERHNRPEGMIALCQQHHDAADQGHYSIDELRALKNSPRSSDDVKENFPSWQKPNLLVRVGGSYFGGCQNVVAVMGNPIIELSRNEIGMLSLSFLLVNEHDQPLIWMVENAFEAYPSDIHDLSVSASQTLVKVWLKARDIGLELSFHRVSLQSLESVLAKDRERAESRFDEVLEELRKQWPPEAQRWFEEIELRPNVLSPGAESLPDESGDPTGHFVKNWAAKECMMSDGLVPFLNFEQMAIFSHGERIAIKDGIGSMQYCASFNNRCGVNLQCPCQVCSPIESPTP